MPKGIDIWFEHGGKFVKMNEAIYKELPSIYKLLIKMCAKEFHTQEIRFTEK